VHGEINDEQGASWGVAVEEHVGESECVDISHRTIRVLHVMP